MSLSGKTGKAAIAYQVAQWCSKYGLPQVVTCIQNALSEKYGRKLYVVIAGGTPWIFHGSGSKEHFSKMWKASVKEAETLDLAVALMKDRGFEQAEYVWLKI